MPPSRGAWNGGADSLEAVLVSRNKLLTARSALSDPKPLTEPRPGVECVLLPLDAARLGGLAAEVVRERWPWSCGIRVAVWKPSRRFKGP